MQRLKIIGNFNYLKFYIDDHRIVPQTKNVPKSENAVVCKELVIHYPNGRKEKVPVTCKRVKHYRKNTWKPGSCWMPIIQLEFNGPIWNFDLADPNINSLEYSLV